VATEAAGEGINLQFCHLMVNYDLPWNPTRLEQRLGRIHRIGQPRDVYAFNFVATSSEDGQPVIEGRILERLLSKLDRMRDALGDRVFDVVGEVLSLNKVNLPDMLREAAYEPRRLDDYLDAIDRIDPQQLDLYEEATGIALARAHVDFSSFAKANLEAEERRLMPRYVESHFQSAAKAVGLRSEARADGLWRIDRPRATTTCRLTPWSRRLASNGRSGDERHMRHKRMLPKGFAAAVSAHSPSRAFPSTYGDGWVTISTKRGTSTGPPERTRAIGSRNRSVLSTVMAD
jgi:superfamily II DNA/RNA helicase